MRLFSSIAMVLWLFGALQMPARAQSEASILIQRLIHQPSSQAVSPLVAKISCGFVLADTANYRTTAPALSELGPAAIPDIDSALDSVEKKGVRSKFSDAAPWLLYAYAKIKGPAAYSRLHKMIAEKKLDFLQYAIDNALALSLGFTAYVDARRSVSLELCRFAEPRQGLDWMILSWEQDDRSEFLSHLGPTAKAAFNSLLAIRSWEEVRADLGLPGENPRIAVAFRFNIDGPWAEPALTLDDDSNTYSLYYHGPTLKTPKIDTVFAGATGRECGKSLVHFVGDYSGITIVGKASPFFPPASYLIDNADISSLLRLISTCAAQK